MISRSDPQAGSCTSTRSPFSISAGNILNCGWIYCDPPYFDAESLYAVDFPKEKHEELHHILSQCAGYIVVSYNDCPFIRSLYGDFFILAFRRNNPLSQKAGATYGELIITNYDPRPYIRLSGPSRSRMMSRQSLFSITTSCSRLEASSKRYRKFVMLFGLTPKDVVVPLKLPRQTL